MSVLPKIQANVGGAADAIMLDVEGYVSETNATNLFCVKNNAVYTPFADHCLPGQFYPMAIACMIVIAKSILETGGISAMT